METRFSVGSVIGRYMSGFSIGFSIIFHSIVVVFFAIKRHLSAFLAGMILLFFVTLFFLHLYFASFSEENMVSIADSYECNTFFNQPVDLRQVIIRVDDVQAHAWREPAIQMITETNKYGFPLVMSVIPYGLDDDKIMVDFLQKQDCGNEIALHGWNNQGAEFEHLSYEEASHRIDQGLNIFAKVFPGWQPKVFVPPENLVSQEAEQAIFDKGFEVISAGDAGEYDAVIEFYDYRLQKFFSAQEIWSKCLLDFEEKNTCIVLIHPQELVDGSNEIDQEKMDQYRAFLEILAKENIHVTTISADREMKKNYLDSHQISTWIADWNFTQEMGYLQSHLQVDQALPFLFQATDTGTIEPIDTPLFTQIKHLPVTTKIYPTIVNHLDAAIAKKILTSPELWKETFSRLISEAKRYGFSGYDIDIENIDPSLQDEYERFLQTFYEQLTSHSLKMSVDVPVKTIDQIAEVAEAYNWENIADSADQVRIMAYDVHSEEGDPGSLIPMKELEHSIQLAINEIPLEKIVIALPTYGYDWTDTGVTSLLYFDIQALKEKYPDYSEALDEESYSMRLLYTDEEGNNHQVWYESAQTLHKKMSVAEEQGITSFSFWRLGNHDPALFSL